MAANGVAWFLPSAEKFGRVRAQSLQVTDVAARSTTDSCTRITRKSISHKKIYGKPKK
jgi:hypothetical protein